MSNTFTYDEFTTRNLGFVTAEQQQRLQQSKVFVCGVGGMGGACIQSLARAGIGELCFADFDTFDVSNLNRQVFANLQTVGVGKVEATLSALRNINPELKLTTYGEDWTQHIDSLCQNYKTIVNGMDDVRAGVLLYRKAAEHGCTVIDAYASPLPSVIVVKPNDPRPEKRLGFSSLNKEWQQLSDDDVTTCVQQELSYVMANSSSANHIVMQYAIEMAQGLRSRMSFAPMVITTGNLMCYEAVASLLGEPHSCDYRGIFYNFYRGRVEKPRGFLTRGLVNFLVRRALKKMLS